jgi:hypothetical protein
MLESNPSRVAVAATKIALAVGLPVGPCIRMMPQVISAGLGSLDANARGPRGFAGLLLTAFFACSSAVCQASDATVIVIDADSGVRLANATVLIEGASGAREATTNASGQAVLADLNPGVYSLQVRLVGYVDPGTARRYIVTRTGAPRHIAGLFRQAAVSGQVTDERGNPVSGVGVIALQLSRTTGELQAINIEAPSVTNDLGRYRLHHLPPGAYLFAAAPLGEVAGSEWAGTVYFPSQRNRALAQVVELESASELPSIDIRLSREEVGSIAGSITGIPEDWPAGSVAVAVLPRDAFTLPVATTMAGPDGRYQLPGVPSGEYRLAVWGPVRGLDLSAPPPDGEARYGSQIIAIRGGEVTPADLALAPGLQLEVRFDTSPSTGACAGVESVRIRPDREWPLWWSFRSRRTATGVAWELPPAAYRVEAPDLHPGCTLAGIREADRAPRKTFELRAPTVLDLIAVRAEAGISGTVRNKGRAASGLIVGLWGEDGRTAVSFVETDAEGTFKFNHIPPGTYAVGVAGRSRKPISVGSSGVARVQIDLDEEEA